MRVQTSPPPAPKRNLPAPGSNPPTDPQPPSAPQPEPDQVQIHSKPAPKSFGAKLTASLLPAAQNAAFGAVACLVHPALGTVIGGLGGLSAGYSLGSGAGKYLGLKLAESGARKGHGSEVAGGIGALGLMFAGPVTGTLVGGLGGAVLPHVATPVAAAAILGGATFVGRFLKESA